MQNGKLHEILSVGDTSNHVNGSREIGLSAVADFDGDGIVDLAVPSFDRRAVRFLSFAGGSAKDIARVELRARAATSFAVDSSPEKAVVVGLEDGTRQRVSLPGRR